VFCCCCCVRVPCASSRGVTGLPRVWPLRWVWWNVQAVAAGKQQPYAILTHFTLCLNSSRHKSCC
jgi:hypothetical protein